MGLRELVDQWNEAEKRLDHHARAKNEAQAARSGLEGAILEEMRRLGVERFSDGARLYEKRPAFGRSVSLVVCDCPEAWKLDRDGTPHQDAQENERPAVAEAATDGEEFATRLGLAGDQPFIGEAHKPIDALAYVVKGSTRPCDDPRCQFPGCQPDDEQIVEAAFEAACEDVFGAEVGPVS